MDTLIFDKVKMLSQYPNCHLNIFFQYYLIPHPQFETIKVHTDELDTRNNHLYRILKPQKASDAYGKA